VSLLTQLWCLLEFCSAAPPLANRTWLFPLAVRLVLHGQFLLAYRIAELLGGAGRDEVLVHWAAAKISANPSTPDAALKEAIAAKMSKLERPKYAALAAHAQVGLGQGGTAASPTPGQPSSGAMTA